MSGAVKPSAEKTVFIIRGLPGSGKTYLASLIAKEFATSSRNSVRICSVDHYFVQEDGSYKFDKRFVGRSHAECLSSFLDALTKGYQSVILDNTNSQRWEYLNYETIAKAFGYQLKVLEIECPSQVVATIFHQRNTHGVPESAHLNMFQRWEPDSRSISIRPWFSEHISMSTPRRTPHGHSSYSKYQNRSQSMHSHGGHPRDPVQFVKKTHHSSGYQSFPAASSSFSHGDSRSDWPPAPYS